MNDLLSHLHLPAWVEVWSIAFPAALCLYLMVCATLHVIFSEAQQRKGKSGPRLSVAILVPAHNEELMLAECLEALLHSDYASLEIHVISDGSSDRTVDIARSFEARGVIVHEYRQNAGKSSVLQAVLDLLTTDLVMVVDADTRLDHNTVSELVAVFDEADVVGATANIQVKNAHSMLARLQAVEYASIIGLMKRANGLLGGLFTVSGAASCFRTQAVRDVGGFASPSVTEDIELSWRLQIHGGRLVYVPQAIARVDVPATWRVLWQQRTRWSQGLTEVLRLHKGAWGSRNPSLYVFVIESLLCMSWLIALALGIVLEGVQYLLGGAAASFQPGFWHVLSFALFLCQTITAAMLDSHYAPTPWWRLLLAVFYPFYFLLIILPTSLIGWTKGLFSASSGRWERSERSVQSEYAALHDHSLRSPDHEPIPQHPLETNP
jgi:biofilm PGA synthesis N-glycosyltransferase PgaC